jgi:hypothetical protein
MGLQASASANSFQNHFTLKKSVEHDISPKRGIQMIPTSTIAYKKAKTMADKLQSNYGNAAKAI